MKDPGFRITTEPTVSGNSLICNTASPTIPIYLNFPVVSTNKKALKLEGDSFSNPIKKQSRFITKRPHILFPAVEQGCTTFLALFERITELVLNRPPDSWGKLYKIMFYLGLLHSPKNSGHAGI